MRTTALTTPPAGPGRAAPRSDAGDHASPSAAERPTFGEMLAEIIPLICAVPGAAPPPVIFLAGPWLLFALMLSGPFAFLVTLVVVMLVAATVLVALTAAILAILASPYLLVRRHRTRHAFSDDHAAQLVPVESTRVAA
jgi:hypothetical protein